MGEGSTGPINWQRLLEAPETTELPANPMRWAVRDLAMAYSVGAVSLAGMQEIAAWQAFEDAA